MVSERKIWQQLIQYKTWSYTSETVVNAFSSASFECQIDLRLFICEIWHWKWKKNKPSIMRVTKYADWSASRGNAIID